MTRTQADSKISKKQIEKFRGQLISWYDCHGRDLPWRYKAGARPDPYRVWLSEIMLQQTTVTAVMPYYTKFLEKWPDIQALAAAPQAEVLAAWAGLGYYARARNLHACAKVVAADLNGRFPDTQAGLRKLPGIGDYTSAAMSAIVYNHDSVVVDGNVERVIARYFAIEKPLPSVKAYLKELATPLFKGFTSRPGDLAQAIMDLGATICIPKAPRCGSCPVARNCAGRLKGIAKDLPFKSAKTKKPQKFGHVYWIEDGRGRILMQRRPEKGLFGGMAGLPTSDWIDIKGRIKPDIKIPLAGIQARKTEKNLHVMHSFTHFDLKLALIRGQKKGNTRLPVEYLWVEGKTLDITEFPSLFRKAAKLFLAEAGS